MKKSLSQKLCICLGTSLVCTLTPAVSNADDWMLIGVTGAQTDGTTDSSGAFVYPDHTLIHINHKNGGVTPFMLLPWVNDSQAMGYCPEDDLIYHTGGSEAYSNNSQRGGHDQDGVTVFGVGYQDSQYMETINLTTRVITPIFNADPCPNPDNSGNDIGNDGLFEPCFGLPAPVPSWVLPQYRRDSTMTDGTNRVTGPNEYHAARGLAWSHAKNCFYVSDELGIFKLTRTGDCTKLTNRPTFTIRGDTVTNTANNDAKGIAFVTVSNVTKLLVGCRLDSSPAGNTNGFIIEVDPESGNVLNQISLNYPPGGADPVGEFGGLLGLAQHPVTGVLYGIRKTDDAFARELVTIDLATGNTTLVGPLNMHITSMAFVKDHYRLVGVTGAQTDATTDGSGNFVYPDHTLCNVSANSAEITKLVLLPWVNDSQAMGYCPTNGLIYHTGGSEAYSNNSQRGGHDQDGVTVFGVGYQDSQYMESVNPSTYALNAIFNADPCPNPDNPGNDIGNDGLFEPCFGLPAPVPSWVRPQYRRDSTMTDGTNRITGPNEYHAARGLAWSTNKNVFYVSDEVGIFKLTTTGDCTKLTNRPTFTVRGDTVTNIVDNDAKGIAFVTVTNVTKLLVGSRLDSSPSGNTNGFIIEVDPDSGNVLNQLALNYPPGGGDPVGEFGGLLGLAQHPLTGVLYGLRKTDDAFARELVTINPITGNTALVGPVNMHLTSFAFVPSFPLKINSITRSGNNLTLTWSGGLPPYQIQSRSSVSSGSWSNVGSPTSALTATLTNAVSGLQGYYQVLGH